MNLISLRGAITVEEDQAEIIDAAMMELMNALVQQNQLDEDQVVNLFVSATSDLVSRYPSVVVREQLGWNETAILNVEEKVVIGQLPRCIRVLLTIQTPRTKSEVVHVYLKEAVKLRPDWQ
ncbi:chorismate mutase [Anoxynatronum sibiricum]|uniref:chorismate mutase n=1 Tax=Anoxynatronum sibiricum TaxID=210623 RepID=A0ABU9VQJ0_9CLOT